MGRGCLQGQFVANGSEECALFRLPLQPGYVVTRHGNTLNIAGRRELRFRDVDECAEDRRPPLLQIGIRQKNEKGGRRDRRGDDDGPVRKRDEALQERELAD